MIPPRFQHPAAGEPGPGVPGGMHTGAMPFHPNMHPGGGQGIIHPGMMHPGMGPGVAPHPGMLPMQAAGGPQGLVPHPGMQPGGGMMGGPSGMPLPHAPLPTAPMGPQMQAPGGAPQPRGLVKNQLMLNRMRGC